MKQVSEHKWQQFDLPAVQRNLVHDSADQKSKEIIVSAEAIHCASCSMLIEKELTKTDGLLEVEVSVTNRRVRLRWNPDLVKLSRLLQTLDETGFTPHPLKGDTNTYVLENRKALKRLLIAGLGMMQVMMYAVGLYAGAFQGMAQDMQMFFHIVSMVVATPVVLYSGAPFFQAAWSALRHRSMGMDVPVSLAIAIAYIASVWAVTTNQGGIYFDSVTMFIFFLSLGRFAEMKARHRAGAASEALTQLTPATAMVVDEYGEHVVAIEELKTGDELLIKPGQTIPSDSVLLDGPCKVDESLLTGESRLITKATGEELIGGSINHSGVIHARVIRIGNDTLLSHISRLLQRAQSERPRLSRLADKVAGYFVSSVIGISVLVGLYWWHIEPSRALEIVLAVLVVTCPCALSLATPAALTVAIGRLAREGLLVTRSEAIEKLANVGYILFDKTGTLTFGQLRIRNVFPLADLTSTDCIDLAATLEKYSEHPIASAFQAPLEDFQADNLQILPGLGIEGMVKSSNAQQRRCRIGKIEFVAELSHSPVLKRPEGEEDSSWVALGDDKQVLAWFELGDLPRPDLGTTCSQLRTLGLRIEMLSGDRSGAVKHLAEQLFIKGRWLLTPDAKLEYMRALQKNGAQVLMVGDGINDAPVMACADVSIAMSSGTNLAQTSADMILMQDSLNRLPLAVVVSRRTLKIIRQNIIWAIAYNAVALPLAAAGLIAPWVAAIGMSFSSLLVVLNALRLGRSSRSRAR
ncbi:MAG: cation-translocating P-type ATPase [Gammaproteobacteria bacterium]|nr:cation-translocating P-type ATPase [Gammaproteobacteria bacterium]